jgi:hypothetical protein
VVEVPGIEGVDVTDCSQSLKENSKFLEET